MVNMIKKAGILGGTFDPIHYGHLIIGREVLEYFNLDRVIFIPSGMPPHKNADEVSPAMHRLNMAKLAVEDDRDFEVSCIETDRKGYSYTVDTLERLMDYYGGSVKLYFIIGADIIKDLLTWREPDRVFGMCEFIAVTRPGYAEDRFSMDVDYLVKTHCAVIHKINTSLIEISSSDIRQRIKDGKSIRYLVPEKVREYIYANKLYT